MANCQIEGDDGSDGGGHRNRRDGLATGRTVMDLAEQTAHREPADQDVHCADETHLDGGTDQAEGVDIHQQCGVQHDFHGETEQDDRQRPLAVGAVGKATDTRALSELLEVVGGDSKVGP